MLIEPLQSRGKGYTLKDTLTLRFAGICYADRGLACYAWALSEGINGLSVFASQADVAAHRGSKFASKDFACYVGLGKGLRWLADQKWNGDFIVQTDYEPIIDYFESGKQCGPLLQQAHGKCLALLRTFGEWKFELIDRKQNEHAFGLCSAAYMEAMKGAAKK